MAASGITRKRHAPDGSRKKSRKGGTKVQDPRATREGESAAGDGPGESAHDPSAGDLGAPEDGPGESALDPSGESDTFGAGESDAIALS